MALVGLYAFVIEPRRLIVKRATIRIAGLDPAVAGIRIALIADPHVGSPWKGLESLPALVERTNAERPDVILLLGDYVVAGMLGVTSATPETIAAELSRLTAPLGVYAVLGNHDHWSDGARMRRALEGAGIRVLEDEAISTGGKNRAFWLVGVSDLWTQPHNVARALKGVTDTAPVIVLTHNPDVFPNVPDRVLLTVAGHTHGGQVRLPLLGALVVPSRRHYAAGEIVEDGRRLFVTSGVGTSILPVRLGVPPEIALLELAP